MPSTRRVLVDCDPGIDDALALIMLCRLHRAGVVRLAAVTTVRGNLPLDVTTRNAAFVLQRCGLFDVPVHAGAPSPISTSVGVAEIEAREFHGEDGLGGCFDGNEVGFGVPDDGVDAIARFARGHGDAPAWLLATGPLTNVALALDADPTIGDALDRVVVMGGAFGDPGGNVTPWAEFNFYADPAAAARVMTSGLGIELVPLDVTERVTLTRSDADALNGRDSISSLAACLVRSSVELHRLSVGRAVAPMHDPLAAALLMHAELTEAVTGGVRVVTDGERAGQASFDERGRVAVSREVDTRRSRELILALLTGDIHDG